MILPLARNTFRECMRRPFPYVAALSVVLLALGSKLFLAFSFGAAATETANVGISAVFLAGFLVATFQGTALARVDLERGTYGLVLSKPVGIGTYAMGRFVGLALATTAVCAGVALALSLAFLVLDPEVVDGRLFAGFGRAILPVLVLDAAALAASAAASRVGAPLLLFGVFLAGALGGHGLLLPDFALFGLEAGARPPFVLLLPYAAIYASIFLVLLLILLRLKRPLRSQG